MRLIDLYGKYPCLWKTSISEYEDAELKRQAWQEISNQLGAHLSPSFVRSRISSMRYRLNVYKLQMIEYKMSPASGKQPEKLYYIDRFGFLDEASGSQQQQEQEQSDNEQAHDRKKLKEQKSSIASIFKQRMQQQQQQAEQLPSVLQRLSQSDRPSAGIKELPESNFDDYSDFSIASIVKKRTAPQGAMQKSMIRPISDSKLVDRRKQSIGDEMLGATATSALVAQGQNPDIDNMLKQRMHRLGMVELGKESAAESLDSLGDFRSSLINIPSVVKKRMRQQLQIGLTRGWFEEQSSSTKPESHISISTTVTALRAMPGDSVSKTKVAKMSHTPKPARSNDDPMSDEEEFYRLHWALRQQQRSRRSGGKSPLRDLMPQPVPPLLLGLRTTSSSNMESVHDSKV